MGDFNARIGQDSADTSPRTCGKYTFHDTTSNNGERLLSLCESTQMRIASTFKPHKPTHQWTWQHPNGSKAQLDHILIKGKWINSLRDCRSYLNEDI